jgi:thiol-disulfide isomerase/thioredoxin
MKIFPYAFLVVATLITAIMCAQEQSTPLAQTILTDIDGNSTSFSEHLQKGPAYVTFWAMWCEPCKQELRALKTLAKKFQDKPVTFLAINQDGPKSVAKVKAFVRTQGYPFSVFLDPNQEVFRQLNGQQIPFSVMVDSTGVIISTHTGYLAGDEKMIEEEIEKLIK